MLNTYAPDMQPCPSCKHVGEMTYTQSSGAWNCAQCGWDNDITMRHFTVIGIYEDTGQNFYDHVLAADQYAAMRQVAANNEAPHTLVLIGAIEGTHKLLDPACDNHTCVCVVDLIEEV